MRITVVGAGIVGRMLAWKLVNQGHELTLIDRDRPEHGSAAAWTAAGMLTPWAEADGAEKALVGAGIDSLKRWPAIASQLGEAIDFRAKGSLLLAHGSDVPELHRFGQALDQQPEPHDARFLNRQSLAELEPALQGRFGEAIYLPSEAQVDSARLMTALADALRGAGVRWIQADIASIPLGLPAEARRADLLIDCRGLGARGQLPILRGVRGEVLHLHAPEVKIQRMLRLMHPRYKLYLVPRRDDVYVLGATQIESEDRGPISVRSALELLSAAFSLHPAFGESRVLKTETNLRPALADNQPLVALQDNLLSVNGLFRHGFLLSPLVTDLALALIDGHALPDTYAWMGQRVASPDTKEIA